MTAEPTKLICNIRVGFPDLELAAIVCCLLNLTWQSRHKTLVEILPAANNILALLRPSVKILNSESHAALCVIFHIVS